MTSEDKNRARDQARAQLESIVSMVKRLEHARECAGDEDCGLPDKEVLEGLELYYEQDMTVSQEEREQYHDEDEALDTIQEDPLEVSVRSDWHHPGQDSEPSEYLILLCTGGPAVRIMGDLNRYREPETANIQYQDWFTQWETLPTTTEEDEALLAYARCLYFGN